MPISQIQAGKLRQRIRIVQPTLAQDSFGGTQIDQATVIAEVWASVEAVMGREMEAGQQIVSQVTHKVRIRWMDGIKAKMNVWFENREFQIINVQNPDERHHELVLMCLERDDSAREGPGPGPDVPGIPVIAGGMTEFTPDGHTQTFTLPGVPRGVMQLFWNGVLQDDPGDYTLALNVITTLFTAGLADKLVAYY